jgi:hypothetical protein
LLLIIGAYRSSVADSLVRRTASCSFDIAHGTFSSDYPRAMRRILGLVAILSCLAATACGSDADDRAPGAAPFSIPVGEPSYDPDAATWAVRGTIHIGDTVLDVQPRPEAYVVTRRGVYYNARGALYFTDGGAAQKVAEVGGVGLAVDPEQQRLALVDRAHGATDPFDTHVAVPVVFDLETGDQVLRAEPGRSLEDDDLAVLYGEIPPDLLGVDGEAVYAVDPLREGDDSDEWRFPLDGGEPEPVEGNPMLQDETGVQGWAEQLPGGRFRWDPVHDDEFEERVRAVLSPGQDVIFVEDGTSGGPSSYFDAESGEPTTFSETPFFLAGWIDDDTFYGAFSPGGSLEGPAGRTTMTACELADRPTCRRLAPDIELPVGTSPRLLFGTGRPVYR